MKNPDKFEQRFGFVAVFDTVKQKRRPLAKHLAEDKKFMEKHGFILLEKPEPPKFEVEKGTNVFEMISDAGGALELQAIIPEKKKRRRPKKQK